MIEKDDFAVIFGTQKGESVEQLRAFSWPEIVERIHYGEFNNRISWVLNTQEMPLDYDEDELKKKHLENYNKYLISILQDLADQQT